MPIKSVTIDQYITHVADYLVTHEITRDGTDLRSRRLTMLLAGYQIADHLGLPMRLTQNIPTTHVLVCQMYEMVDMVVRDAPGRRPCERLSPWDMACRFDRVNTLIMERRRVSRAS